MNEADGVQVLSDGPFLVGERMSFSFLASIVDHVAHPIFVKDRAFRFVLLNQAIERMLGMARGAMLGRTDYDFFPKTEADFFRAKDIEVFECGGEVRIDEEVITDHLGARHTLQTTKVPLRDAQGQVTHIVGIIHDITALKQAEEALRHANEALERRVAERSADLAVAQAELMRRERLAVVGQLASAIAHQIRNPLGAIKNAAYLVQMATRTLIDDDLQAAIQVVHEEVRRANQIITDLLDYARIRPPTFRVVSLGYVVDQALGGVAVPSVVTVHNMVGPEHDVCCDPEQLQTALFNLFRGSVESLSDGGEVTVQAARRDGLCELCVIDTGPGLPDDLREQLADPLHTHGRHVAMGLHLMTARALTENQGATFTVELEPGRGTRFTLLLPTQLRT